MVWNFSIYEERSSRKKTNGLGGLMLTPHAPCTCEDPFIRALQKYSCAMDVWEPTRVRMSVGMANVPPELPDLPANVAMCHVTLLTV